MEPIYSDHSRVDERSLAMHRLVAAKLRENPAILEEARNNLRRWQKMAGSPAVALAEWEGILNAPIDQISHLLEERSERANRLRQSSPFAGVLTEAERRSIYESFLTRTYHPSGKPSLG